MIATDKIGTFMKWRDLLNEFPEMYVGLTDWVDLEEGFMVN